MTMPATNLQIDALAQSTTFQAAVRAAIYKHALKIVQHVRANGTIENPLPGKPPVYTAAQLTLAKDFCTNRINANPYFSLLACSASVLGSNISDAMNGQVVTDINDVTLDLQVFTVVFSDLL